MKSSQCPILHASHAVGRMLADYSRLRLGSPAEVTEAALELAEGSAASAGSCLDKLYQSRRCV
jgi:hypothetical protein